MTIAKHSLVFLLFLGVVCARGAELYVSHWGSNVAPYATWADAATNLQDAVDAAGSGDTVWVTNGVYISGSGDGGGLASRLVVTNGARVQSVNGYRYTVIQGAVHSAATNLGPDAVRGVYMTNGVLNGFTVRKGYTDDSGLLEQIAGGGVFMNGGTQDACRVAGNYGQTAGGAWLSECVISNGLYEYNFSETGARVKLFRRVKLKNTRINNTGMHFPDIRILGTDDSVVTNADWGVNTNNGTLYGAVDVSSGEATHVFTITNQGSRVLNISGVSTNGGAADDFQVSGLTNPVIGVAETATFSVRFDPQETGERKTALFVSNDDPDDDPYVIWLAGIGVEPEMFVLSTNYSVITNGSVNPMLALNTDFGEVGVMAGVATNVYTITNAGNATLNLATTEVTGWDAADFSVTVAPAATVLTGEVTTFTVEFDPSVTGVRTTLVSIASDAPDTPYTFVIQGTGVEPEMQVLGSNGALIANQDLSPTLADGTDFGICEAGAVTHTFTITNAGSSELQLTNVPYVVIAGAHSNDFTVTAQPTSPLAVGGVSTFDVQFFPLSASLRTAEVLIMNNDSYHTNAAYTFAIRGAGSLSNQFVDIGADIQNVGAADLAWGDYDNDGLLDLAMLGYDGTNRFTDVYRNDGGGSFTNINAGFSQMESGRLAWGDYDNDGDLDIAMAGYAGLVTVSEIYRNDGGTFTNINAGLTGAYNGGLDWGDYDNDGDLDLVVSGFTRSNSVSQIYKNNDGVFTNINANLLALRDGRAGWVDYDGDGWLDLLIMGDNGSQKLTRMYKNYSGSFSNAPSVSLQGVGYGDMSWADYDQDGDLDLALCGYSDTGMVSRIYQYNGGVQPYVSADVALDAVWLSSCEWGDYDNDGDPDLLMVGAGTNNSRVAKIYRNDDGTMTELDNKMLGMRVAAATWGDYDNDGDLDIAMSGQTTNGYKSFIYRNLAPTANVPPSPPGGLDQAVVQGNKVLLSWNEATDTETPSGSLTYNVYVGTSTNLNEIRSGEADASGWRRVVRMGNAEMKRTVLLENMPSTELHWGVQAIDASYAGSTWATGGSVTPNPLPDFVIADISIDTVPFTAFVTVSNMGVVSGDAGNLSVWLDQPSEVSCGTAADQTNTTVGTLAAGASTVIEFTGFVQPTALESKTFRAFINSDCSELEERTDNNQATAQYEVGTYDDFWFNAFALTNNVYLRWINPTNCGLKTSSAQVRFSTTDYPAEVTDGTQVYTGTDQVYQHTGLTPGQPYYYSIWLSNDGTNWVAPPD